jgi:hypothetical protein
MTFAPGFVSLRLFAVQQDNVNCGDFELKVSAR